MTDVNYELEKLEIGPHDVLVCYLHVEHIHPEKVPEYVMSVRESFRTALPGKKVIVINKYGSTPRTTLEAMSKEELTAILNDIID